MQLNDTSSTLNGIRQDIYFVAKINANTFPTGDLNRVINKYYKQLQSDIRNLNENFYAITVQTDLVVGDGRYAFPDGTGTPPTGETIAPAYEKVKNLKIALTPADITNPLETEFQRVQMIDSNSITDPSYEFTSPTAVVYGDYFELFPKVTDNTKYPVKNGITMDIIPTLDELVNDTDKPKIYADYHDVITWGSCIDVATRIGNDALLKTANAMYKKRRDEMMDSASNRIMDGQSGIIEGQDNGGGWEFPFGQTQMS